MAGAGEDPGTRGARRRPGRPFWAQPAPRPPARPPRPAGPDPTLPPGPGASAWTCTRALFRAAAHVGWTALLELVLLGMVWGVLLFLGGAALVGTLTHGGGLVMIYLLPPLPLWAPATVGLNAAVDGIWSGELIGPFDALRAFFAGFGRRYLRSVGLGALWVIVFVGTYANVTLSSHLLPAWMLGATKVLLLYLLLFIAMLHVYLMPILATTDFGLPRAVRLATWEAVANPTFTLACLVVPAVVLFLALAFTPIIAVLLLGGAASLFAAGGLRFVPLRHPSLPASYWTRQPLDDAPEAGPDGAGEGEQRGDGGDPR
jgi:uncharacterized membrane protein YesL